ncbi:hypothetical protein ACFO3O_00770 [Dokdonia ponticola]|uniref:Lipoprotein n=1 Tax=Dokdonia ponticola TaxID=2041041 RepID=A0ABV9HQJ2_9FLAO
MKKLLPLLVFTIFISSCSSPTDKKIFEKLTVEDLKTAIENDTLFKSTYQLIEFQKDSVLTTELDKVKWSDLTYSRIHELVEFANDTTLTKPLKEQFEKEWKSKYGIVAEQIDSVSVYWKKYAKENSLDQYVKVELVSLDKDYYSYSSGVRSVNLGFKLTPLKGKIEQMRFGYEIQSKLDEDNEKSEYSYLLSTMDYSWCRMSRPFSKPTTRYWEANYTNEKILESRSVKTLLRDYNVNIAVDEIRIDGKNIDRDDLGIPKSIERHWEYENKEYLSDLYMDDVAKEVLGKNYVRNYEYRNEKMDSIYREKDKLAYEFITLKKDKAE